MADQWQPLTGADLDAMLKGGQQSAPPSAPPSAPEAAPAPAADASSSYPQLSRWQKFKMGVNSTLTGNDRTEYPDAQEFGPAYEAMPMSREEQGEMIQSHWLPDAGAPGSRKAAMTAINQSDVTPDPQAQIDIIKKAIPGLETKTDAYGNVMLKAPGMSDWAYLNKPGFSRKDVSEFATQTMATAPILALTGGTGGALVNTGTKALPVISRMAQPGVINSAVRSAAGMGLSSVAEDAAATAAGSDQGIDTDRAIQAAELGGAVPVASAVGKGVLGGAMAIPGAVRDTYQAASNPKMVAARNVQRAFDEDAASGSLFNPQRTAQPSDRALAAGNNQDLRVMDYGGEAVADEARKAANLSASARDSLMRVIGDRFTTQAPRTAEFIEGPMGLSKSADQVRSDLMNAGRNARAPQYNAAFQQGKDGYTSPVIDQLKTSPTFQKAMGKAEFTLQDQAATPGWTTTGMNGKNGYTLEFWDQVKRNLDDMAGKAIRQNKKTAAGTISGMATALRTDLDSKFPLYQQARGTAQAFFKADNALEAGENFMKGNFNLKSAEQQVTRLNSAEKNLFQEGAADQLVQKVRATPDRSNMLNRIAQSPMEQDRIRIALGQQKYDQLDSFLRLEGIMQKMKDAMGNSTSVRQGISAIKGYGIQALGSGAGVYGTVTGDPYTAVLGAIFAGGRAAQLHINANVAKEVATLLTSKNPDMFLQGMQQVGKAPISTAIRALDDLVSRGGTANQAILQGIFNGESYDAQPASGGGGQ